MTVVIELLNNNQTPFDEVYANDSNTFHASAYNSSLIWNTFLQNEFGLINFTKCQAPHSAVTAPTPQFNTKKWYGCPGERLHFEVTEGIGIDNLYDYTWNTWGAGMGSYSGIGETFDVSQSKAGDYNIKLTRSYSQASGVIGPPSSYTRVVTVFPSWNPNYCGGLDNGGHGGNIPRLAGPSLSKEYLGEESDISAWPNPVREVLHLGYSMAKEGKVKISLVAINGAYGKETTITNSWRPQGNFTENYYMHDMPNGIYLLTIQTGNKKTQRKIIIQK